MAKAKKETQEEMFARRIAEALERIGSGDAGIREDAVEVLGALGGKKAVQILIRAMKDENGKVRMKAADALIEINDKSCIPELKKLAEGKDPGVSLDAKMVLEHMTAGKSRSGSLNEAFSYLLGGFERISGNKEKASMTKEKAKALIEYGEEMAKAEKDKNEAKEFYYRPRKNSN